VSDCDIMPLIIMKYYTCIIVLSYIYDLMLIFAPNFRTVQCQIYKRSKCQACWINLLDKSYNTEMYTQLGGLLAIYKWFWASIILFFSEIC